MAAATLTIDINARLAKFETDLGKVAHLSERHAQQMDRAFRRVGGALAALGAGISLGAAVAGIKDLIGAAAGLDDLAEKTGASVEELSKLEQVVRIGGHQMEVAEATLIRLSKALHGSDEEAKGAGKALAALGLNAEELRRKDTAEALRIVAERLNQYQDGAGKTALALDLLGKSGAQALPFLKDLATEGGIVSRVSAEQAAAAEELQKSLARLGNQVRGTGEAMALNMVPALAEVVQGIRQAYIESGALTAAWVALGGATAFVLGKTSIQELRAEIKEIERILQEGGTFLDPELPIRLDKFQELKLRDRLSKLKRELREVLEPPKIDLPKQDLSQYVSAAEKKAKELPKPFQELNRQLEEALAKTGELTEFEKNLNLIWTARFEEQRRREPEAVTRLEQQILARARQIDAVKALDKAEKDATESRRKRDQENEASLIKYRNEIEGLAQKFTEIADPFARYRRDRAELERLMEVKPDKKPLWVEALFKIENEAEDALQRLGGKIQTSTDQWTEFLREGARNMQDAFADNFFDLMQGRFEDLGGKFKTMIDRMVANLLGSQLLNFLTGDFGKTGVLGGVIGELIKNIPKFDVGTPFVPRDMVAVVHRGERIVPAAENRRGAGVGVSMVVHQQFVIAAPTDGRSQMQLAAEAARGLRKAARNL